jgi:amidase
MNYNDYRRYDAVGLARLVDQGEVSAEALLATAVARMEAVNPRINAECIPMRDIAAARVREKLRGPLAGVPFLIKDIVQDYAGVVSTAGSRALRQHVPKQHSRYVERALDAGLVIFGKTTTPEFALKGITESELWGATRNPWDLERTPGGSSGGAAAVVAAGVVPMAGANDGGGSIRIPASHCGLFGLRPSRGRVPVGPAAAELWEGASSDLVVSRSVRDAAAMLDALCGPDPGAPFQVQSPEDAWSMQASKPLRKLRIGFTLGSPIKGEVHPAAINAVKHTARLLEGLGHEVEMAEPDIDGRMVARAYLTMYFGQVAASVAEARAQGARGRDFELDTRSLASLGRALSAGDYVRMHRRWNDIGRALASWFQRYDLYLTPTVATPPVRIGELTAPPAVRLAQKVALALPSGKLLLRSGIVDKLAFESLEKTPFTQLANLAGVPAMSVPLHWTEEGLPMGSQFIAPWGGEDLLLQLATQLEQAQPWFDRLAPLD